MNHIELFSRILTDRKTGYAMVDFSKSKNLWNREHHNVIWAVDNHRSIGAYQPVVIPLSKSHIVDDVIINYFLYFRFEIPLLCAHHRPLEDSEM